MLYRILDQIEQHKCGKHLVFGEEQPLQLRFRSKCECCGKSWFFTLPMIKFAMSNPKLDLDGRKSLLKRIRDITDNKKYKKKVHDMSVIHSTEDNKYLNFNALSNLSIDELFKKILIGEI